MQDSHENPTPTPPEASAGGDTPPVEPTIETTPEPATEPAAAPDLSTTPASTPVEATETTPTVDAPASDPTPATNTAPASNPFLSSTDPTPAAAPVTPSASTPITPAPGEKKSNKGIILGVVIGVIVLAIIGICVFLFLNNDNKKSDNNVSNNGSSQEEKSEKKEEKKEEKEKEEPKTSAKSIEVGYAGKSFAVTDSYADTVKNAAKSFDIYYEDDNIDLVKIEDIDEYLKGVTPSTTSVHVYITNEEGDDVIEIIGIADYNDYGKESVAYSDLTIREVWLAAYESESYTLGNVSLTLNKTTVDDIKKAFGEKFEYGEDTKTYSYKNWNRFDVDLFMNDDNTLNFVTLEPTFE
jgi:hypothetical protein